MTASVSGSTRATRTTFTAPAAFATSSSCCLAAPGRNLADPYGELYFINRARENPKSVRPEVIKLRGEKRVDGYVLEAFIPAVAILVGTRRNTLNWASRTRWSTKSWGNRLLAATRSSLTGTIRACGARSNWCARRIQGLAG